MFKRHNGDGLILNRYASLVNLIIEGGAANLSQVTPENIPQWREDELTLNEAFSDPDFGAFVLAEVPDRL